MALTEKEEKIVNYMSNLVGTSLDRIDNSAKDMIKYNTALLTILTGLATYFKVNVNHVIIPIILIALGLIFFIITIQPVPANYTVGEVDSSVRTYNQMAKRKYYFLKAGYICTYLGFIWFIFVLIA